MSTTGATPQWGIVSGELDKYKFDAEAEVCDDVKEIQLETIRVFVDDEKVDYHSLSEELQEEIVLVLLDADVDCWQYD